MGCKWADMQNDYPDSEAEAPLGCDCGACESCCYYYPDEEEDENK